MTPPSNLNSDCKSSKYKVKTALIEMGNILDSDRGSGLSNRINKASLQNSEGIHFKYQSKLDFNFDKEDNLKFSLRKDPTTATFQQKMLITNNSSVNSFFQNQPKLSSRFD